MSLPSSSLAARRYRRLAGCSSPRRGRASQPSSSSCSAASGMQRRETLLLAGGLRCQLRRCLLTTATSHSIPASHSTGVVTLRAASPLPSLLPSPPPPPPPLPHRRSVELREPAAARGLPQVLLLLSLDGAELRLSVEEGGEEEAGGGVAAGEAAAAEAAGAEEAGGEEAGGEAGGDAPSAATADGARLRRWTILPAALSLARSDGCEDTPFTPSVREQAAFARDAPVRAATDRSLLPALWRFGNPYSEVGPPRPPLHVAALLTRRRSQLKLRTGAPPWLLRRRPLLAAGAAHGAAAGCASRRETQPRYGRDLGDVQPRASREPAVIPLHSCRPFTAAGPSQLQSPPCGQAPTARWCPP